MDLFTSIGEFDLRDWQYSYNIKTYESEEDYPNWKIGFELKNFSYDKNSLFFLLKFTFDSMVYYWENETCETEESERIKLASRLLTIIVNEGYDDHHLWGRLPFPYYVNKRNAWRFTAEIDKRQIRYWKAYHVFFRLLEYNVHTWINM